MFLRKKKVEKELFSQIMEKGACIYGSFFTFRYFINEQEPKYSVVVPKNIIKKAFKRNYFRRRGYSAIRIFKPMRGVGIFFYNKKGVSASFEEIKEDIGLLLKKSKILK